MKLPALLLSLAFASSCFAQTATSLAPQSTPQISVAVAQRENAMAPGYAAQKAGDMEGAYRIFVDALPAFPRDARVMMLAAGAARDTGRLEEALALYQREMQADRVYTNRILPDIIQIYAALNRWDDFDATRKKAREAALANEKGLTADQGYIIEDYKDGARRIQVLEFPKPFGRFHTRYRFLTVSLFDPKTHFTPYFDLESDDIDQVGFKQEQPDKAAAGDRRYSLDSYPKVGTQGLIRFYDGEPTYEALRADVLGSITRTPAASTTVTGPTSTPAPRPIPMQ